MKRRLMLMYRCALLLISLSISLVAPRAFAALDGGVDPANLGKGSWIYVLSYATNHLNGHVDSVTSINSLMAYLKSQGFDYVIVKAGTGSTNYNGGLSSPQFSTNLCTRAHNNGLKIFGYTRSYGSDIAGEIALAGRVFDCGADGFVIDAEAEWESSNSWIGSNGPTLATQLASGIKSNWPNKFLGHAPMPIISYHSSFPYREFGYYCDAVMPQDYWVDFQKTPCETINWMDTEWRNFHNSLTGKWTNSIKPLAPVGAVYDTSVPVQDVTEFMDYLLADPACVTAGGYKGCSFWSATEHSAAQWDAMKNGTMGDMAGVVSHIVIDNVTATKVGTWSSASSSTDKFGTNYIYKSQGTGAAYIQFTPNIVTAGNYDVYEWHPVGANRSTAAPHIVKYAGANSTVLVNQQLNGGQWNLLGTFQFNAGTAGYVRIADNFSDAGQIVMADGIKFVFAGSTVVNPPVAPSGLSASAISASQINLAWTDNSTDEDNFVVARSTTSGGPYTDIATVNANSTGYSDLGLSSGTTYYYVVRAVNAGGDSANSSQASATTPSAPAAPSNLSATANSTSKIILTWTDNSSNETSFVIARSGLAGGPYSDIATVGANVTTYTNTGLSQNTTYYYVVRASNATGSSANSNEDSATTLGPPAAPSNLTATTVSASQINLTWVDNSSNENNFIVARSLTTGGVYTDVAILGANVTSYSDTGLSAGTKYYYVVRASNGIGSSANSAEASATTLSGVPTAPSGLAATALSSSAIKLTWTDNSSNETGIVVARSTTAGGPYTTIASLAAGSTVYTNTGLAATTTYYYVVRATNAAGSSVNSAEAAATTLGTAPAAPSGLVATALSSSSIKLTWTDNSSNEDGIIVARSTTSGGPYTDIATLAAGSTVYTNTGLTAGTTYYYVVRAFNAVGSSANSAQASAVPVADIIIDNPSATFVGTWSTGTGSTDKYGTNYRYVTAPGTGTWTATFRPTIPVAGKYAVYEWHCQGSNRTTSAPHIVSYSGGSVTNSINQTTNGGKWNLVGTYNFAAGTNGTLKITDKFSGTSTTVVIADAMKFVLSN